MLRPAQLSLEPLAKPGAEPVYFTYTRSRTRSGGGSAARPGDSVSAEAAGVSSLPALLAGAKTCSPLHNHVHIGCHRRSSDQQAIPHPGIGERPHHIGAVDVARKPKLNPACIVEELDLIGRQLEIETGEVVLKLRYPSRADDR